MEPLTSNELQAIAITMRGIKYPDTDRNFVLEAYHGIFFRKLADKFQVNDTIVKQKLENMQVNRPQQFQILFEKMKIFWDTQPSETELIVRLSELKLI